MAIPGWLVQASGAMKFANNPANGFAPTMGDVMQGIGHSLAEHYRNGQGVAPGAAPAPAPAAPSLAPSPVTAAPPVVPVGQVQLPPINFTHPDIQGLSGKTMGLIADLFKQ